MVLLDEVDQIVYSNGSLLTDQHLKNCVSTEDYIEIFCDKLELLRPHSFIASEQPASTKNARPVWSQEKF